MIEKLIKIQKELKAPKSQFNKFGGYKYRNAEDILEALKPLLAESGCAIILSDEIVNVGNRFYVKATVKLFDDKNSFEVSAYAREEESKKGMDGSQITGASSSYARKYALNGMFAIDDTKDSDATNQGDSKDERVIAKINNAKSEKELKAIYATLTPEQQPLYLKDLSSKKESLKDVS